MLSVRRLPIPDSKTVNKLLASCRQTSLDGVQSVIYSHLRGSVTRFPLSFVDFDLLGSRGRHQAWRRRRVCQAWVNRQQKTSNVNPTRAALAEDVALMLAMLPWGVCLGGTLAFFS